MSIPLIEIDNCTSTDVLSKNIFVENCELMRKNKSEKITEEVKDKLDKIQLNAVFYRNKYTKLITVHAKHVNIVFNFLKSHFFSTNILFNVKIVFVWNANIYIKFYDTEDYSKHIKTKFNKLLLKKINKYRPNTYIDVIKCINDFQWLRAHCYTRNYNKILSQNGYYFCAREHNINYDKYWSVSFKT